MHWRNERGETMPDQKTIDLIGYVHTSNKSKMYEKNKELEAQTQSVRNNGLGFSKETQDKMMEFVKANSKATLQDVIKEFFNK